VNQAVEDGHGLSRLSGLQQRWAAMAAASAWKKEAEESYCVNWCPVAVAEDLADELQGQRCWQPEKGH